MGARFTSAMAASIIAAAFVVTAIAVAIIANRQGDDQPSPSGVSSGPPLDPIRAELFRCQRLGEAGAQDAGCLHVWAERRRRFLMPEAPKDPERLPHPGNVAPSQKAAPAVPPTPAPNATMDGETDRAVPTNEVRPSADKPASE
ncbi:hypothetical protein LMIY3S_00043 [Labrys miyagiensis]